MKRTIILSAVVCMTIAVSADPTSFRWFNASETGLTDNNGAVIENGDSTILTYVSDDNIIDFDTTIALSATYGNDTLVYDSVTVGPSGRLMTDYMTEGDAGNNYQGKYVYAVAFDKVYSTYTGLGSIGIGTYYNIGLISGTVLVDPTAPSTPQSFNSGDIKTSLQAIPEPAVASFIVIFGGGLLVGRRIFFKG